MDFRDVWVFCVLSFFAIALALVPVDGQCAEKGSLKAGKIPLKIVETTARDAYANPEYAIDGDPTTEFTINWANGGATLVYDLGGPTVVERVVIKSGPTGGPYHLGEVSVSPDKKNFRPLLSRAINLVTLPKGEARDLQLVPSVGRYISLYFGGGGKVGIGEIEIYGRPNLPERHLCHWWGGDTKADFLDAMDYLDEIRVTDIWIDKIASVMTNSRPNYGFDVLVKSGVLKELKKRGINYWLSEDEGFGGLVNHPDDLRDERKWRTTLSHARQVYAQAKKLGFRGIAMDAEDYQTPADPAVLEKYGKAADAVECWTFYDEFGYAGHYYQRGLELGKVIQEVWGCPVIQFYEAVMYDGIPNCRDGNYWWLKGMSDAGVEIWIGTEKSYGRGNKELYDPEVGYPEFVTHSFIDLPAFIGDVHRRFPFAARVIPGFHPWITGFGGGVPNYLPKYLDEQLSITENGAFGCWIYNGGTPHAGDPRKVLGNKEFLEKHRITAQDYIDVFNKHKTSRSH